MLTKPQNIIEYLRHKSITVQVHFMNIHRFTTFAYCYDQTIFELIQGRKKKKKKPNTLLVS